MSLQIVANAWVVDKLSTYIGSGAHARPRHYQHVLCQYRSGGSWARGKRGYGLEVGRRESLFWGSHSYSFGDDVLLG